MRRLITERRSIRIKNSESRNLWTTAPGRFPFVWSNKIYVIDAYEICRWKSRLCKVYSCVDLSVVFCRTKAPPFCFAYTSELHIEFQYSFQLVISFEKSSRKFLKYFTGSGTYFTYNFRKFVQVRFQSVQSWNTNFAVS